MTSTQLVLGPPELQQFAEHLRDETWLDMRVVDVGTVQRVRIDSINIHRERDVIVVTQKWAEGEQVHSEEFALDAEDVRWLRATQVALEEVTPMRLPTRMLDARRVIEEIVRTVAFLTEGVSAGDLTSGGKVTGCIRPRQEAMWLAYEMTELSPLAIAKDHFGYASQQPMLTVQQKLRLAATQGEPVNYGEAPGAWLERVRVTMKLIDSNLGVRCRRTLDQPWVRVL